MWWSMTTNDEDIVCVGAELLMQGHRVALAEGCARAVVNPGRPPAKLNDERGGPLRASPSVEWGGNDEDLADIPPGQRPVDPAGYYRTTQR